MCSGGGRLPLAGELLPLHVGPDLLGHVRRPDRRAAEDRLHGVRATLEVDRVAPERFLRLRHVSPFSSGGRPRPAPRAEGINTIGTRGKKQKTPPLGGCPPRADIPPTGTGAQRPVNAGITSRANQRSCSLNSLGESPSAQWTMKSSSPGYFASIDLMPSITCCGGPQNHAFCWMPSASVGMRAGAPGVPHVRPCSSA